MLGNRNATLKTVSIHVCILQSSESKKNLCQYKIKYDNKVNFAMWFVAAACQTMVF